ncbi:MAG: S41 family peptidase [Sphingobacteriales bacterium]|jgi:carboxyl-terminal processing protease|nr:S41 family peptidase [Sphingobacteriales bacterium]MCC7056513.1 S41 family peptidase [Chitinophagales bacterium]MDA0198137.1 S41 family peptidase [Bacteroidota bacterium]MBK6889281.1 S41 family peptidase [Sphingobacteriales bacterium]MBK7528220.1 S41 family peptidase [Sphingobacteriales bacterium]
MTKKWFIRCLVLASIGLGLGFVVPANHFEITKNAELFVNIVHQLESYYVDEINPDKFIKTGVDAMMASLDPYTVYVSEEEMDGFKIQTTGKYGGIGALISSKDNNIIVAEPYQGYPAAKNDLRAGDIILEIDGIKVKGKKTDEVSRMLKGQPGTPVKILLQRLNEPKPLSLTLLRQEIKLSSVPYFGMLSPQVGYIVLADFTDNCYFEVANALQELKNTHKATSIILDLRGNPGGLLDEAVNVASLFLNNGQTVVYTKSRNREGDKYYKTDREPIDNNIPLAVMIDRGSASAAEIVAGVIQDTDRGIVLGNRSFGKGLVQTTHPLPYDTKLKITTGKYYLPSGRCIQAIDYSGGYRDNLDKVADSLRTAYKTKNGRKVLDAGGIDPDITIPEFEYSLITSSLLQKELIFDYATLFRTKNETIPQPEEFELTEAQLNDFFAYIKDKSYDYLTESEKLLKDLQKNIENEKYLPLVKDDMQKLENQIQHDKLNDLQKYKSEIKFALEHEIAMRYFFHKGQIKEMLEDDPVVIKALQALNDKTTYQKLLN